MARWLTTFFFLGEFEKGFAPLPVFVFCSLARALLH
jgi:hypothetical protein